MDLADNLKFSVPQFQTHTNAIPHENMLAHVQRVSRFRQALRLADKVFI